MSRVRAVLLDAAGTLIELREPVGESYARRAREQGAAISAWRFGEAFGRVLRQAPPMVFPEAPRDAIESLERDWWRGVVRAALRAADSTVRLADFEAFFEALWADFADPGAWRARPGAAQALEALRDAGVRCAVVSNFDHRLPRLLDGLGLLRLLDAVVLPSDTQTAKPDPAHFAAALERLGVAASDAVVVGDDPERDLAAARAAGLRAIDASGLATLAELPSRLAELPAPGPREEEDR